MVRPLDTPSLSAALYIPPKIIYHDHGIPKWLHIQLDLVSKLNLFQDEWSQLLAQFIALERKFGFHEKPVSRVHSLFYYSNCSVL